MIDIDIDIRQSVLDALEFAPSIDAAVDNGVVTLTGVLSDKCDPVSVCSIPPDVRRRRADAASQFQSCRLLRRPMHEFFSAVDTHKVRNFYSSRNAL
jgi:hypothetical protein